MAHISEKGFQVGALVGTVLVGPLTAYRHSRKAGSLAGAGNPVLKAVGTSALVGLSATTLLGIARITNLHMTLSPQEFADGMQDRAYRLHYNSGQRRTDLFSELGMAIGATGALLFVSPAAAVVLGGGCGGGSWCGCVWSHKPNKRCITISTHLLYQVPLP